MSIQVIQAGSFTTIQDEGRTGWAHLGVPKSGFMDEVSANLANQMVGNDLTEGLLEVTWTGLEFTIEQNCSLALAGASFECTVNEHKVDHDQVIQLAKGDHFKMTKLLNGVRGYLAFAGGLDVPKIAGSVSTLTVANLGGFKGRVLKNGDLLKLKQPKWVIPRKKVPWKKIKPQSIHVIRAIPGPEVNKFTPKSIRQAFGQAYQLSKDSNRQGFRLQSNVIDYPSDCSIKSSGLVPGTLQVTPDGQSILAMKDAQTTGGYPRILVVNQDQLHKLAQVRPGELVYFFVKI